MWCQSWCLLAEIHCSTLKLCGWSQEMMLSWPELNQISLICWIRWALICTDDWVLGSLRRSYGINMIWTWINSFEYYFTWRNIQLSAILMCRVWPIPICTLGSKATCFLQANQADWIIIEVFASLSGSYSQFVTSSLLHTLWGFKLAIEHGHRNSKFSHPKW